MAKIQNKTGFQLKFVAYRADGLRLSMDAPKLDNGDCLQIQGSDTAGFDWSILLVFLPDSNVPPAVSVIQAVSGLGVSFGANILGTGGSIGVNTVSTVEFSTPLAMHVIGDDTDYLVQMSGTSVEFNAATPSSPVSNCKDTKQLGDKIDYSRFSNS